MKSFICGILTILMGYVLFGVFMKSKANTDTYNQVMPVVPAIEQNKYKDNWQDQEKSHAKRHKKAKKHHRQAD